MILKGVTNGISIFPKMLRITKITNYFMISNTRYCPGILLVDKQNTRFTIIDKACRSDRRVDTKQEEKVNKYLGLELEIKELWKTKV